MTDDFNERKAEWIANLVEFVRINEVFYEKKRTSYPHEDQMKGAAAADEIARLKRFLKRAKKARDWKTMEKITAGVNVLAHRTEAQWDAVDETPDSPKQ